MNAELITKDELKLMISETVNSYELHNDLKATFTELMNKMFIEIPTIFNYFSINDIDVSSDDTEIYIDFVSVHDIKKIQIFNVIVISKDMISIDSREYSDDENSDFYRELLREFTKDFDEQPNQINNVINYLKTNII